MFKKIIIILLTVIITISTVAELSICCFAAESASIFTKSTEEKMWKFTRIRSSEELKQFTWKSNDVNAHHAFIVFPAYASPTSAVNESELYNKLYLMYGLDRFVCGTGGSDETYYKYKVGKAKDKYPDFDINTDVFYMSGSDAQYLPQIFSVGEEKDETKPFYGQQFGLKASSESLSIYLNSRRYCDNQWRKYDRENKRPCFIDNPWSRNNAGSWILGFRDNTNLGDGIFHGDTEACKIVGGVVSNVWHTDDVMVVNEYYELDSMQMRFEYYEDCDYIQVYDRAGFTSEEDGSNAYIWIGEEVPLETLNKTVTIKSGTVVETDSVTIIGYKAVITIEPGAVLDISKQTFCSGKIYNYGTINIRDGATFTLSYNNDGGQILNKYSDDTYSDTGKKYEGNLSVADGSTLSIDKGSISNDGSTVYLKGTLDLVKKTLGRTENERLTLAFSNKAEFFGYSNANIILKTNTALDSFTTISGNSLKKGNLQSIRSTSANDHTISKFLELVSTAKKKKVWVS